MPLFNLFKKKTLGPYKTPSLNKIYELLFCDDLSLYKTDPKPSKHPWDILLADSPDPNKLKEVIADKNLETRSRILAYRLLAPEDPPEKELLAAIVEVSMPRGLDVLAAFSDGTARYINHAEKLLVWENRTPESNSLIGQLLTHSANIVTRIGPWDQPRRAYPENGLVRLTFLASDGLYFGEGPFDALQDDPMAAPVLATATQLMAYLTSAALKSSSS